MHSHKPCVYQLDQNYPRPPHGRIVVSSYNNACTYTIGIRALWIYLYAGLLAKMAFMAQRAFLG